MAYLDITVNRATEPELVTLIKQLSSGLGESVLVHHLVGTKDYRLKKASEWSGADTIAASTIISNSPAITEQLQAQVEIDDLPVLLKAIVLTLIDELNILRTAAGLQPRTTQQAITAIRAKAGTL
jgi:hypothetical protein